MKRRQFLGCGCGLAAAALPLPSLARTDASKAVNVVKCLLFSCPICRSSESIDTAIDKAARTTGGRLVHAPLPLDDDMGAAIYYAARNSSPQLEARVRASLYKAVQDMGIEMRDQFRALVWLQQDLADLDVDWARLLETAASPSVQTSLARAASLAVNSGVSNTPTYILVAGSEARKAFDPAGVAPAGSLSALRDRVIQSITELAA